MNWLRNSFNESWEHLNKYFNRKWESKIKLCKKSGFRKRCETETLNKSHDFRIVHTHKDVYDKLVRVRNDIKSDYYRLSSTLAEVMKIA